MPLANHLRGRQGAIFIERILFMDKKYDEMKELIYTAETIKKTLKEYDNITNNNQNCDKKGKGFNRDERFTTFSMKLSIDSWLGYYGNSSCSRIIDVGDEGIFKKYFLQILNKYFDKLLLETAEKIMDEAILLKEEALNELKTEIEKIEKLGQ
jgi:hypothetical protein